MSGTEPMTPDEHIDQKIRAFAERLAKMIDDRANAYRRVRYGESESETDSRHATARALEDVSKLVRTASQPIGS